MPTYSVTDPSSGRTIDLTGDSPPTEQELEQVFASVNQQPAAGMAAPSAAPQTAMLNAGSPQALNQARAKAGTIGQQRFQSQDPLVQQADFYLGRDSARKFQKYVAGNYEPLTDEDFTDRERQFLVDYENKRGRKVLGGAIKYGGPLAAQFFPGGQVIAGEMAYPAIANIVGQMVSPDNFSVSEAAAELVPGVSLSKKAAAPGLKSFLTTAETGVAQQSSLGKQVVKEFGAGAGTSLVKSGIEAMGGEITGGDVIQNAIVGGLLYPSISTGGRALSAAAKGRLSASKIAGEFQRPFMQQFFAERTAEIQKRLGGGAGIDPALSDQLASTLYSPEFSGTGAEAVQNWNDRIKQFIGESVVNGRRSGLSGDELTQAIVEELKQVSGKPDVDPNLVDVIVRKSDELTEQAKNNVDQFLNSKNSELVGLARRAEGELQLESQNIKNQIRDLTVQKNNLPTTNQAEREQLTNQIAEKTRQIQQIEEGFDSRFPAGKPISAFEAGTEVGKIGKEEVKKFEDAQEKGFGEIRPELKRTTVEIDTGKVDKEGNPVLETKSLEDLRKIRSQIYRLFDFNAPVQQGFFESWDRLNKINDQITQAFDQNPALRDALAAQNKSYAEGIKRFKGAYVNRILRNIGEAGGAPEAVSSLIGSKGGTAMSALKDMAGERWNSEVKPILSDYIYNQIRGEKPTDFLNTLIEAKGARGKLSKEVANEFFPSIAEIQDVAKTYKSLIDEQAELTANSKELKKQQDQLIKDVDAGISGSEKLLAANEKAIKSNEAQLQKILINQKDDTAKRLADLKAAVLDNKNIRLDDDEIKTILANPNAKDLVKNLSDYVSQVSEKQSEFQQALARSLKSGKLETTPTPGDIVDFLKQSTDTLSSRNRSVKFMEIINASRPELQGDVQNIIVGRIVEDALSKDKKMIDAAKMKQLVAGGDSPGPYNAMVTAAFGKDGVSKISKIADQLSDLTADKETILQKTVLPFIVGSTVATYFGGGPLTAVGAGGLAISQRRAAMSIAKNVGAATVGKILLNPTYISTVSKPIDSLTKTQLDTFTRQWPKILTLEFERMKMHDENQKLEERQMRESQRQMRRRD
jgi:hypothetical protein